MRTSQSQFETMVNFMIEHGDLSKPATDARSRVIMMQRWEQLTELLNSDASGDTKTTNKWKKVWSDYKNNTKKKVARIHKVGPGSAKLNDLELQVVSFLGIRVEKWVATLTSSLPPPPVQETGFKQVFLADTLLAERPLSQQIQVENIKTDIESDRDYEVMNVEYDASHKWHDPGPSNQHHMAPTSPPECDSDSSPVQVDTDAASDSRIDAAHPPSPSEPRIRVRSVQSVQPGRTIPRPIGRPIWVKASSLRRLNVKPGQSVPQDFQSDREWRSFCMRQHKDYMDMRREQNRIRELELETQREWQNLASRAFDLLNRVVEKYCKD